MKIIKLKEEADASFKWPDDTEKYDKCLHYGVENPPYRSEPCEVSIAFRKKTAFGRERQHILIFRDGNKPLIELNGSDDWDNSKIVVWAIKENGGMKNVISANEIPADYSKFDTVPFRDLINTKGAYHCYAVKIREDDHEKLIELGLLREFGKSEKAK